MNNSYITIIKEKRTDLSRKRIPLNQNKCTADFRMSVPFEQNLHAAIVITAMPNDMAQKMKIDTFRDTYQTYISLCIIAIGAYYVLNLLGWIKKRIWAKFHNWKKVGIDYMKKYMSQDEMWLLIETFYNDKNAKFGSSGFIDCMDGRKAALESKHIIYLASRTGSIIDGFPYNLQPYALEFLNKNLYEENIVINGDRMSFQLK